MTWLQILAVWTAGSVFFCLALGQIIKSGNRSTTAAVASTSAPIVKTLAWCPSEGADGYVLYMSNTADGPLARLVLSGPYLGQTQVRVQLTYPEEFFAVSAFQYQPDGTILEGAACPLIVYPCEPNCPVIPPCP